MKEHRLQFSPGKDIECFLDEVRSSLQAGPAKHGTARATGTYASAPASESTLCTPHIGACLMLRFCLQFAHGRPHGEPILSTFRSSSQLQVCVTI